MSSSLDGWSKAFSEDAFLTTPSEMNSRILSFVLAAACVLLARAEIDVPTDGSDGDLILTDTGTPREVVIDLSLAPTAAWNTPQTQPHLPDVGGVGVYDSAQWAVVFKYNTVRIEKNVTVRFKNHPSRAPVVWLVKGNVEIAGEVNLDGAYGDTDGSRFNLSEPGPGGFRGGDGPVPGSPWSPGLGPGGSAGADGSLHLFNQWIQRPSYGSVGAAGNFAAVPVYGNSSIIPLVGGSGSGGQVQRAGGGGGAGGGAVLIAVRGDFNLLASGRLQANGGGGPDGEGGTGGAIRVICGSATGSGLLQAIGNSGAGNGRIRLEYGRYQAAFAIQPPSLALPIVGSIRIWPDDLAATAKIVSVANAPAPTDPRAGMEVGLPADMILTPGLATKVVTIETANLPTNAVVTLRVVSSGGDVRVNADFLSTTADPTKLLWQKEVTLSPGYHALQVVAVSP